MYAQGMIGNRKAIELAGTTLGVILNYLSSGKKTLTMRDVLGSVYDFYEGPAQKTPEELEAMRAEKTKTNLNAFLMSSGGCA